MEYRGQQIDDKIWVTRYEDYKELGSNDFDLNYDDLKELQNTLENKELELKEKNIVFKNLRFNFYATEYRERDYGPDDESECSVTFAYDTLETEEESKDRIQRKKKWIDQKIKEEEQKAQRDKDNNEREVNRALEVLRKNGYKI